MRGRLDGLLALRGIAATCVVFCHVVFLNRLNAPGAYFLASHATLAVELFFIVSAFSLCFGYEQKLRNSGALSEYALRRVLRILPMFYAMVAAWILYRWIVHSAPKSFAEIVANLTFTFGLIPSIHTSVVPAGWSIGVECLFYAVFPLFLLVLTTRVKTLAALAIAICLGCWWSQLRWSGIGGTYVRMNIITQLPIFLMGILAYREYQVLRDLPADERRYFARVFLAIGCAIVLGCMLTLKIYGIAARLNLMTAYRYAFSSGLALIVLALAMAPFRGVVNNVTTSLGIISYSTYLIHPLVISYFRVEHKSFIASVPHNWFGVAELLAIVLGVTMVLGTLTYMLIEKPADAIGREPSKIVPVPVS